MTLLLAAAHPLVHVNATLNAVATCLLVLGLVLIKQHREIAHRNVMLAAFGVSAAFLACYVYYHTVIQLQQEFTHPGPVRYVYLTILATHVVLAMTVPFLAVATIRFGLHAHGLWLPRNIRLMSPADQAVFAKRSRERHRRLARITFPIWLYVSVTGVIVYTMLYHLWPPA